MKKLLLLLLLGICFTPLALNAASVAIEDTSLVRISTAEARATFLSRMMKERLDLDAEEYAAIQDINIRYEELLQDITLNSAAPSFGKPAKKKGESPLEKLSEAREKEIKKALSGKHYKEYNKQRWGMKNMLKKQMLAEKEANDKRMRELQLQQEKARADSIAAEKASQKKKKNKKAPQKAPQKASQKKKKR
jgi:hypothetical protein